MKTLSPFRTADEGQAILAGGQASIDIQVAEVPVRIGFVMHVMQVAGAEVLVKQIIERLAGKIDATVFCLDGLGTLGQHLVDHGTPVVVLGRRPGLDWKVTKRLATEVKNRDIEILHAHQYTPFFYAALARMVHGAKVKMIFTEHGRHYPDVVSWKRRSANRWWLRRYADVTTACCDFSTRSLHEIEGFPAATTLNNGVDVNLLPPRGNAKAQIELRKQLGLDSHRPYAACVARFHPVKDHATLIRGWARVHQHLPQAKLLLIGDGPERQSIQQLIKSLSASALPHSCTLSDSIEFCGIRSDVGDILRSVNVFALTSVSEAASLTLLEAMASQCAAVVTQVGGNAEHLRHGIDGYLVPRGDDSQLATRLIELLENPETAARFGNAARQRVQKQFDLTNAVAKYQSLYQKLAQRRGGR
jgi:L-malate glycosyltransferase